MAWSLQTIGPSVFLPLKAAGLNRLNQLVELGACSDLPLGWIPNGGCDFLSLSEQLNWLDGAQSLSSVRSRLAINWASTRVFY